MSKVRRSHLAEFRQQMVGLVRAGHSPADLSRGFGVTAQTITNCVDKAASVVALKVQKPSAEPQPTLL